MIKAIRTYFRDFVVPEDVTSAQAGEQVQVLVLDRDF